MELPLWPLIIASQKGVYGPYLSCSLPDIVDMRQNLDIVRLLECRVYVVVDVLSKALISYARMAEGCCVRDACPMVFAHCVCAYFALCK